MEEGIDNDFCIGVCLSVFILMGFWRLLRIFGFYRFYRDGLVDFVEKCSRIGFEGFFWSFDIGRFFGCGWVKDRILGIDFYEFLCLIDLVKMDEWILEV